MNNHPETVESIRKLENLKAEYVRLADLQGAIYDKVMGELELLGHVAERSDHPYVVDPIVDAVTDFLDNDPDQSAAELLEGLKYGSWPEVIR